MTAISLKIYHFNFFLDSKLQFLYFIISSLNIIRLNYLFIILSLNFLFKNNKILNFILIYNFFFVQLTKHDFFYTNYQLLIGLNNIHPVFFYFSFILFLRILHIKRSLLIGKLSHSFILAAISLALGGFWGLGNNIWGFFWVNDSIEVILLLYCLLLLFLLHYYFQSKSRYYILFFFLILCIKIYLLRAGFSFTRHSFFNLKSSINISLYFVIFFFNIYNFCFFYLYLYILKFIVIIYIYIIHKGLIGVFKYRNISVLIHFFILIIFLSWLKFKINNFLLYSTNNYIFYNIQFYSNIITTNSIFLIFKSKINLFITNSFMIYTYKFFFFFKKIISSYQIYVLFIITLISISKIYFIINTKVGLIL